MIYVVMFYSALSTIVFLFVSVTCFTIRCSHLGVFSFFLSGIGFFSFVTVYNEIVEKSRPRNRTIPTAKTKESKIN